jgi:hypothetical protein
MTITHARAKLAKIASEVERKSDVNCKMIYFGCDRGWNQVSRLL